MSDIELLGLEIAKKLTVIRNAEQEKLVTQSQLAALNAQVSSLTEYLNKLDATITSTKYEITHRMNETPQPLVSLTVVKSEK